MRYTAAQDIRLIQVETDFSALIYHLRTETFFYKMYVFCGYSSAAVNDNEF